MMRRLKRLLRRCPARFQRPIRSRGLREPRCIRERGHGGSHVAPSVHGFDLVEFDA